MNMQPTPRVSVVMPCFNQGRFVEEAIASVNNQTTKDVEIILVEDCSTDEFTRDYIRKTSFENTKKILNNRNLGVCESRNIGIQEARGFFILPLDADDKIAPNFISLALDVIESGTADVIYSDAQLFGEQNNLYKLKDFSLSRMLQGNVVVNTALYRKAAWAHVGGYSSEMKAGVEDWDFWLSLIESGQRFHKINRPLFYYRQHGTSRTTSAKKHDEQLKKIIFSRHRNLYGKHGIRRYEQLATLDQKTHPKMSRWLNRKLSSVRKRLRLLRYGSTYPQKKRLPLYYYNPPSQRNFGDQLNIDLLKRLTGRPICFASEQTATHICIGSLLELILERKHSPQKHDEPLSIWGAGFIAREGKHPVIKTDTTGEFIRPVHIHAVRGFLTLERLKSMGIDVSKAAVGDPGLLANLLVPKKTVPKKWLLGIVPHYVDSKEPIFEQLHKRFSSSKIIHVDQKPTDFLADLQKCEVIISSAMHGLIAADSLGIPNIRAKVSDRITGGDFKFLDYYSAFDLSPPAITLNEMLTLSENDLTDIQSNYAITSNAVNAINCNLLSSCPFMNFEIGTADLSRDAA